MLKWMVFFLLEIFRSRQKKSTTIDAQILTDLLYKIAKYWRKIYWIEFGHRRKKRQPFIGSYIFDTMWNRNDDIKRDERDTENGTYWPFNTEMFNHHIQFFFCFFNPITTFAIFLRFISHSLPAIARCSKRERVRKGKQ